jgi:hypothetical protein
LSSHRKIALDFGFGIQCPIHNEHGSLPCPWPDCANGIEEPAFEGTFPGSKKSDIYRRVEWAPFEGVPYYSWESDLQAWFSADKVASQEAERRFSPRGEPIETIYHYTSTAALLGILRENSLWLSDFTYLNDSTELRHGARIADGVISTLLDEPGGPAPAFLASWLNGLRAEVRPRICMTSFSLDGDNLSQWRSYGEISIGFGRPFYWGYLPETRLDRVIYDTPTQRNIIRLFAHHCVAAFMHDAQHHQHHLAESLEAYASLDRLYRRLIFYKNPAFVDEREVRLVYVEDPGLFQRLGQATAPKHFRTKGNLVIPYVRTTDLNRGKDKIPLPIEKIIIGPQPNGNLLQSGVRELLNSYGYNSVDVSRSEIPYRSIPPE